MDQAAVSKEPVGARTVDRPHLFGRPPWAFVYLFFVFTPLVFNPGNNIRPLVFSALACALFIPLFLAALRSRDARPHALLTSVLGLALILVNPGGNTLIIYAMGLWGYSLQARNAIVVSAILLLLMSAELIWVMPNLSLALGFTAIATVIGTMVLASTLYDRVQHRRMADHRLSQDEVRRLAALGERERIARDLHDLLGHTLSVVVLKSELAGKLIERDVAAARTQIGEIEQVARQALRDVRAAVTNIRASDLQAELAAARLALLGAEVELDVQMADLPLRTEVDAELAMCLREAVTNVLRHAQASRVEVELSAREDRLLLQISDDGRGGIGKHGNGLLGLHERVAALGGELSVDSPRGGGTRLQFAIARHWRAASTDGAAT